MRLPSPSLSPSNVWLVFSIPFSFVDENLFIHLKTFNFNLLSILQANYTVSFRFRIMAPSTHIPFHFVALQKHPKPTS